MAEILEDYKFVRNGRPSQYPWDEWLDGKTRKIVHGEDFECKVESMASQVRNTANERGLSTSLRSDEETGTIIFQAYEKVEKVNEAVEDLESDDFDVEVEIEEDL